MGVILASSGAVIGVIVYLAVIIFEIAALWMAFVKAGRPGWAAIIPIYNLYVIIKLAGRPGWWLVLFIIPLVNIVIALIVYLDLAKSYNKGTGFGIGLFFLSFIFIPILGFGPATYVGPGGRPVAA